MRKNKIICAKKLSWFNPGKIVEEMIWQDIVDASHYAKGAMLDVGCGNKQYYPIFKNCVTSYIGTDIRSQEADIIGDFLTMKITSHIYDTILCTQVIEHVTNPNQLLHKINSALKKNGILILTAPLIGSLHEIPYDYYRYTKYALELLLKNNGFEIITIKDEGNWILSISLLTCFYLEGTYNKYFLRYPKKIFIAIIQYSLYTLSSFLPARFTKPHLCPMNYLVIARKK